MPRTCNPRKIPIEFALEQLNLSLRGYQHTASLSLQDLMDLSSDDGALIPVSNLKGFFNKPRHFTTFKRERLSNIPEEAWERALSNNPRLSRYIKKFAPQIVASGSSSSDSSRASSPVGNRRNRYKMMSHLGKMTQRHLNRLSKTDSALFIEPANDESDEEDVNLPQPICKGIRRVCRYYDSNRRYKPFSKDDSENKRYLFNVRYEN
ncbi:hypothetical protein CDAR_304891 [Caerostris darwini]|uniref:Uncharacterized protein n=1 Tax=Caerostris darwini TaxID=1538125 RepID=A0AAV4Q6N3_9ARAC|nr:hypothetical protein CDAR_304891 [Caerostris darwini]